MEYHIHTLSPDFKAVEQHDQNDALNIGAINLTQLERIMFQRFITDIYTIGHDGVLGQGESYDFIGPPKVAQVNDVLDWALSTFTVADAASLQRNDVLTQALSLSEQRIDLLESLHAYLRMGKTTDCLLLNSAKYIPIKAAFKAHNASISNSSFYVDKAPLNQIDPVINALMNHARDMDKRLRFRQIIPNHVVTPHISSD